MWKNKAFVQPCPLTRSQLEGLFERIDQSASKGCDHTRRLSRAYAVEFGVSPEALEEWLSIHGAGCDCEVLFNTVNYYEMAIENEDEARP